MIPKGKRHVFPRDRKTISFHFSRLSSPLRPLQPLQRLLVACVAGGIVRVRRKILRVESDYGRRSREKNGKEPLCRENWRLRRHCLALASHASPLASRGLAARIGGSAAIASRWPRTRDNIPPARQASRKCTV